VNVVLGVEMSGGGEEWVAIAGDLLEVGVERLLERIKRLGHINITLTDDSNSPVCALHERSPQSK
jgi:hypothetical protein